MQPIYRFKVIPDRDPVFIRNSSKEKWSETQQQDTLAGVNHLINIATTVKVIFRMMMRFSVSVLAMIA